MENKAGWFTYAEPKRFGVQTLDNSATMASRQAKPLFARMSAILKWCDKRSIGQVYAFFRGCDPSIEKYEARVRLVIRTTHHTVMEEDLPWIESMEATMDALSNRQAAA